MAANEIHVGDIGTVFEVTIMDNTVVVDLTGATDLKLNFKKPDTGDTLNKTAILVTDGTDGKIKYTTLAADLDESGEWLLQGFITIPGGSWNSDISTFMVYDNIV